jgi:hypothetical protein
MVASVNQISLVILQLLIAKAHLQISMKMNRLKMNSHRCNSLLPSKVTKASTFPMLLGTLNYLHEYFLWED